MLTLKNCFKFEKHSIVMFFAIPAWFTISFFSAQLVISVILELIKYFCPLLLSINDSVLNITLSVLLYTITLLIVAGIPWLLLKKGTVNKRDLGIDRLMSWTDMLMAPAGMVAYLILTFCLTTLATKLLPWFDINQVQDTGFNQLTQRYEYLLAFFTLVVIAPFAEELLFRGYLYGKLKKYIPIWLAVLVTSAIFGAFHGAWNLAVDTFALSLVLCALREITGSIWSSILLHMMKNGLAFFILFIYPFISATIK